MYVKNGVRWKPKRSFLFIIASKKINIYDD